MSKPVLSDPFVLTAGRRNRRSFIEALLLQTLAVCVLAGIGMAAWGAPDRLSAGLGLGDYLMILFLIMAGIPLLLYHLATGAQRCRDCGLTGWVALALMVPVVNLALVIALAACQGQPGTNRHGEDPIRGIDANSTRLEALLEQAALHEHYER